jgi:mannose-6-phosphate isomerase class I
MTYLNGASNFEKYPSTKIHGNDLEVFAGYDQIAAKLKESIFKNDFILTIETYVGVSDQVLDALVERLKPSTVIRSIDIFYPSDVMQKMMARYITDDRVYGIAYTGEWSDFVEPERLEKAKEQVRQAKGLTLIFGVGASYISKGDCLVYADMAIWELQMRYRNGTPNFNATNVVEEQIRKFKRGYFIDWRLSNRQKASLFEEFDFYLDTVWNDKPAMLTRKVFETGLKEMLHQPFRTIPFFDEGLWGGQWMKEVCDVEDKSRINYAWSYNLLFQENEVNLQFGDTRVNIPGYTIMLRYPKLLIGEKGFSRFGAEYPIRYDFLDTMEGGYLSLQVHPDTQYYQQNFGVPFTQDESYYFLDCGPTDTFMHLGLKTGVKKEDVERDLKRAARGEIDFPADKYTNKIYVKKHDHLHVPAGTIHCAGPNTMVLEISSAPCIFTFKLWDWGRVGMDGIPRPTHIDRGMKVIQWDKGTEWVNETCAFPAFKVDGGEGWIEEKTGLHEFEFIETRRVTTSVKVHRSTHNETHALHLVDGREALIESPTGQFKPFIIHFAESVCIPAGISEYTFRPCGESENKEVSLIIGYVRY